jgi:four helix bundle protein
MPRGTRGNLADQLRRAAGSVHANLAEGEGRTTPADRAAFFRIAWASLRELEAHCALAQSLGLLTPSDVPALRTTCRHVGRLLHALLRSTAPASPAPPLPQVPAVAPRPRRRSKPP